MPRNFIHKPEQLARLIVELKEQDLPLTVSYVKGVKRTVMQNNLIHQWYKDAANQLGDTSESSVRAECKLMFGVPILRAGDEVFASWYDGCIKRMNYAAKRELFKKLDPAVTSKMTVKQLSEYMDAMQRHFAPMGVYLTNPDDLKYGGKVA